MNKSLLCFALLPCLMGAGCSGEPVTVKATAKPSVAPTAEQVVTPSNEPAEVPAAQPKIQTTEPVKTEEARKESCSCPSSDMDCPDFSSHEEAQNVYDCCYKKYGYDKHRLDRDKDGLACERN